jgi:hypothetical protein
MMKQHPLKDICLRPQTKLEIHKTKLSHNIKKKTNKNHLVITKADKSNLQVTLHGDDCNKKIKINLSHRRILLSYHMTC